MVAIRQPKDDQSQRIQFTHLRARSREKHISTTCVFEPCSTWCAVKMYKSVVRSTVSTGVENTVCEYTFYPSLGHCRTSPTWRAFVSRSINLSGDYLSPNADNSDLYHKCVYGDIRERKFPIEVKQKFRSEVEMSAQFTMIGHTAYNLSKKDAFRINEFINCTEMFLGDKWTHSLLINSGTKSDREKAFVSTAENNHVHDVYDTNEMTKMFGDEDVDEDDDEAYYMYRGMRNRSPYQQ